MTGSSHFFSNYIFCAGNKKVSTADHNGCYVSGQGFIFFAK